MKTAVIYARYSSSSQTEQSIEGQLRKCHKYAEENDFLILHEYIDKAKTGQNDNRPEFQQMLADSEKRQFEYVIVYAVDRFARSDMDYGADKKILQQNCVKLLSATETIGINADGTENLGGILTEGILVAVAKYYSRELSKKVKRGQFETLQKKTFLGGTLLYGYKVIDKHILINEEQAAIVRIAFDMYANGKTAFDVANYFRERGITNASGRQFVPNSIMNMLKNKKYIGILTYGEYVIENYYPPIIDKDTFEKVQEKMAANKRSPARMKAYESYLLSGKLYCGYCGSLMTGEAGTSHTKNIHHYYKCFGKKKGSDCKKKNIKKKAIEDLVIENTIKHVLEPTAREEMITLILEYQKDKRAKAEAAILKKELSQIQSYIKNIIEAIKHGIYTDETKSELDNLTAQKEALEEKIALAEFATEIEVTHEQLEFWFEQFAKCDGGDIETRQYLVNYFINKIILFDDKCVIVYNHMGKNRDELSLDEINEALKESLGSDLPKVSAPRATAFEPRGKRIEIHFRKRCCGRGCYTTKISREVTRTMIKFTDRTESLSKI